MMPRPVRRPIRDAVSRVFRGAVRHLGLPAAEELAGKGAANKIRPYSILGGKVKVDSIGKLRLSRVSTAVAGDEVGSQIAGTLHEQGFPTDLKSGNVLYVGHQYTMEDMNSAASGLQNAMDKVHEQIRGDTRKVSIEVQDHYVGLPYGESNIMDLLHASIADSLTNRTGHKFVLWDDMHLLAGPGITYEEQKADERNLNDFVKTHLGTDDYKMVSEGELAKVHRQLMELAGEKREGECPDFDSLLYILKLGKKQEFVKRFAGKFGVDEEKVSQVMKNLPEIEATHTFVSLPRVETLPTQEEPAYYTSEQKSAMDRLREYGFGHLIPKIKANLWDLPSLVKGVEPRHFESFFSGVGGTRPDGSEVTGEEMRDARVNILTYGRHGSADIDRILSETKVPAPSGKHRDVVNTSFEFSKLVGTVESYPEVLRQAHENLDVELLPSYFSELADTYDKFRESITEEQRAGLSKDHRYTAAMGMAHGVVSDLAKWMGTDKASKPEGGPLHIEFVLGENGLAPA